MNKSLIKTIITVLIFVVVIAIGLYFLIKPYWSGIKPVLIPADQKIDQIVEDINNKKSADNGPFDIHKDFNLSVLTSDLENPRAMVFDGVGRVLVSEPSLGRVVAIDQAEEVEVTTVIDGLNMPHGIALQNSHLFVAETGQILRYDYNQKTKEATSGRVILDLPADGRHWTRTIGFGPDGYLYMSIGNSCNICLETDWRRAKILRYNIETQELDIYASGLRNSVFFAWHPVTDQLFATEMGRDLLGDDLPPDEINLIQEGRDYGFPYCYGQNIVDPEFDRSDKCRNTEPAFYNLNAHESPLGIDFLNGDMIVALHGSWNRSDPIGYEVIRLTEESDYQERETLISGWLQSDNTSIGRPAGILVDQDKGIIYISDDKEGVIYTLTNTSNPK